MNILITGAGGFIGSHLVDRCKADGHAVGGIDRKAEILWTRGQQECDCEIYEDCRDIHRFGDQIAVKIDLCFHLAAYARIQPSFSDPMGYVANNIVGTANMLDFCRRRNIRMVYAGSSTADDDVTKNVYAATKYSGEILCKTWAKCFGTDVAIARFYNAYGPRQIEDGPDATVIGIWEKQLREGKLLTVTGNGSQRRDFTHVLDIVDGLMAIAERGVGQGEVYGLGCGKNYSITEAARLFAPEPYPIEFLPARPGESARTLADTQKTEDAIGWRAKHRLEDYASEVFRFCANTTV